ncbi:MAG: hypothetical protein EOO12_06535, partial [Chitinophagaceae bacterium]
MKLRLLLLLFSATTLAASAQTDSGLRGRTLFLEIERAKRLPPGEQPAALVRIARTAAESSQELTHLLRAAGSRESATGMGALLEAAEARVSSLGADRNSTGPLTAADRALARLPADTATQVRLLLADAAAFAGQADRSAAYRLQAEAALRGSDNPLDRMANLDALTRISNGPAVSSGYRELLRAPSLGELDRVHILSRLLINL